MGGSLILQTTNDFSSVTVNLAVDLESLRLDNFDSDRDRDGDGDKIKESKEFRNEGMNTRRD